MYVSNQMAVTQYRLGRAQGDLTSPNPRKAYLGRLAARGLSDIVHGRVPMPYVPQEVVDRDYDLMNRGLLE